MSGHLAVIGLGPGDARYLTAEAVEALAAAQALYGYGPYLDRVPVRANQSRHASENREERARAAAALAHAARGARVAVVSGGDPGVFAMAAAVCEEIESGPESWRTLDVSIVPGITAMLAVAARIGAPLGHDFCVLSLSDNLKPWALIERRLDAAAGAASCSRFTIRCRGHGRGNLLPRSSGCAGICRPRRPSCSAAPSDGRMSRSASSRLMPPTRRLPTWRHSSSSDRARPA